MVNPFYIEPASPLKGFSSLMEGVESRFDFEQKKGQEQQKIEIRKKVAELAKAGKTDEIYDLAIKHPWVTEEIKGSSKWHNDEIEADAIAAAERVLNGESPGQVGIEHSEKVTAAGGDANKQIEQVKKDQVNPEAARKRAEIFLAIHAPARYEALRKATGKDKQNNAPSGYRYKEDGTLEAIPGGPATGERAPEGYYWEEKNKLAPIPGGPADKKNKSDESSLEIGYRTYLSANNKQNSPESYAAYQKNKAAQKKEMQKATVTRPYMAELMSQGYIPSTRVTGPMLDAYEAAAAKAAENGKPLTVEDLRDMEFQAVKNRATGQSAGSRLTIQRKQNIEAAYGLLDDLKATSKKLDYSPARFVAEIDRFIKGQSNDPVLTEYMTQRADALFVLGNALKQNGLTDKSIEVEEEAATPTLSPQAFEAWYNTQLRALNRAAKEMNTDYKYGIPTVPTVPAGKGGAGPATDTGGTPPAAGWSIKRVE